MRAHSMVLPETERSTPPPSNQMPRPQEAVPNIACEVPEMRLSVTVIEPSANDLREDRAIVVATAPVTVDQKIEVGDEVAGGAAAGQEVKRRRRRRWWSRR